MNHVNENALGKTIEIFSREPEKAVKEFAVEGDWVLEEGRPQFLAHVPFEGGTIDTKRWRSTDKQRGAPWKTPASISGTGSISAG